MNEHTLKVLEFDKIRTIIAAFAASDRGKAAAVKMLPSGDRLSVITRIRETEEFTRILQSGEHPPLDGIPDVDQALKKLMVTGGTLFPDELLSVAGLVSAGRRIKKFFLRFEGRGSVTCSYPLLCKRTSELEPLKHIEEAVSRTIDDKGAVKDSASPDLRKIRKQIAKTREDILGRMAGILQDAGFQKVIQEPVVTVRDDRYVLPLKPNFRQSLRGVVHGQSGSRSTLFVEPLDVLEQNNRLAELRMDEREEVERILRELTSLLSKDADKIEQTARILEDVDLIYARARFGIEYGGVIPIIRDGPGLQLRAARHPLLAAKSRAGGNSGDVMPNDIVLGGEHRALIVSGPNAGGKTVILKTAGILCLMTQSGVPVTAGEGTELPCFSSIVADIGDEQSLEQDLSTFSAHVSRVAEILKNADKESLVLIDELGSGTDPAEGAGLGAAVLETLIQRGCTTVVTTHDRALKLFGSQTGGAVNAAMEFDPATLKPTYRLIPGRPGRSYGLDMAARLGIPDDVIRNARARLSQDDVKLEQLLKQVEEESRMLSSERQVFERALAAAKKEQDEAHAALRAAREEAREVKFKAKAEATEVLARLRRKLRELSRASTLERTEIQKAGAEAESIGRILEPEVSEKVFSAAFLADIHPGATVRIARLNKPALVLARHRDMLELEVSGKKLKVPIAEVGPLELLPDTHSPGITPGWSADFSGDEIAVDRLNIIGLRVNDGLAEVERFIDRASAGHVSIVTIIHGLGTGALKAAVNDLLKNHPLVASMRSGTPSEGGAGVTVAELKK